jgi:hypothetical protein
MQVIVNQHIKNGKVQSQWGAVHGGNHRPHRIRGYDKVTDATLKRLKENAARAIINQYEGEEGKGYILQTTFFL